MTTTDLQVMDDLAPIGVEGAEFKQNALVLAPDLPIERYEEIGQLIGQIDKASAWWVGDWAAQGEAMYAEKYSQVADATGLSPGRVMNCASVARQIPPEYRRDGLSFFHHERAAGISGTIEEIDHWLGQAETEGWTGRQFVMKLREAGLLQGEGTIQQQLHEAQERLYETGRQLEELNALAEPVLLETGILVRCPSCGTVQRREEALPVVDA